MPGKRVAALAWTLHDLKARRSLQVDVPQVPSERVVSGSRWIGTHPAEVHQGPVPAASEVQRRPWLVGTRALLFTVHWILLNVLLAVMKLVGVVTVVVLLGLTGHQLGQALHTAHILEIFKLVGWGALDTMLLPGLCAFTFGHMHQTRQTRG